MTRRRRAPRARPRSVRAIVKWAGLSVLASFTLAAIASRFSSGETARAPHVEPPSSSPSSSRPEPSRAPSASPWASPEACAEFVAAGRPPRPAGTLRVATWNVRWFPDGRPGERSQAEGRGPVATHLAWLACGLASIDADAVALQEIKSTPRARAALETVVRTLDELTSGSWQFELDGCAGPGRQHIGVLYDARRLRRRDGFDLGVLNPRGPDACDHMLRPGHAVYFERDAGADFHFVSVHLKSGAGREDLELRRTSALAIGRAHADAERRVADADVIVAGDMNTMGCPRCKPKLTPVQELTDLDRTLASAEPAFRRVVGPACSEYYRGGPSLLDHFVVHRGMREVPSAARAVVHGFCADVGCGRIADGEMPRAYYELSDHCPIVLELDDRDLD